MNNMIQLGYDDTHLDSESNFYVYSTNF